MPEFILNHALKVEKIQHDEPEISIFVTEDFLKNPEELLDYARSNAYFGNVGDDRTAYPGIRDRLPRPYERAMGKIIEQVYKVRNPDIHRCMLSMTTLNPNLLSTAQKIPHVDAFGDDQFAAVHFLCGESHGGTAIYRYRPRGLVRIRNGDRAVVREMINSVSEYPEEHTGYLIGDTSLFKQELVIKAKFNRLILYPSNLLHCALLTSSDSFDKDISTGRLTVASFFRLEQNIL